MPRPGRFRCSTRSCRAPRRDRVVRDKAAGLLDRLSRCGGRAGAPRRRRHHDDLRVSLALPARDRGACRGAGGDLEPDADPVDRAPAAAGQAGRRADRQRREPDAPSISSPPAPTRATPGRRHRWRPRIHPGHARRRARGSMPPPPSATSSTPATRWSRAHPDTGAIVLECTNMVPYARALRDHLRLPVFSIYSLRHLVPRRARAARFRPARQRRRASGASGERRRDPLRDAPRIAGCCCG